MSYANDLCASGFGEAWDGTYNIILTDFESRDRWINSNGRYWLYHDSWYWYISSSPTFYGDKIDSTTDGKYAVARKAWTVNDPSPVGHYEGIDANPDGDVSLNAC